MEQSAFDPRPASQVRDRHCFMVSGQDRLARHDEHWYGAAAAGFLAAIFAGDISQPTVQCSSCGGTAALSHALADGATNVVVRCAACHEVMLRLLHLPTVTMLDLHGIERVALSRQTTRGF